MRVRSLLPALLLVATACASASGGTANDGTPRGNANLLTTAELDPVATLSVLEAIQRLRPTWLRGRSGEDPVVFLDGTQMGDPGVLRSMSAAMVQEVRYRSASDATMRYGTGFGGGAIEVRTKG